jgi:DNA-directed RNA polymerase subunit H (RpoH/RPB5)
MSATENSEVTDCLHIKYLLNDIRIEKRTENMNLFQLYNIRCTYLPKINKKDTQKNQSEGS